MPRQTPDQIATEIVDKAAALFARQGFANTALQQIAEAVGYTKAGVLHHFPSKLAIYRAAVDATKKQVAQLAELSAAGTPGLDSDRVVLDASVDLVYASPGIAALSYRLGEQDDPTDPDLMLAAEQLAAALRINGDAADERLVRVAVAFAGLQQAAMLAVALDLKHEWRPRIITAALEALGHRQH